jgi:hypothetical protein
MADKGVGDEGVVCGGQGHVVVWWKQSNSGGVVSGQYTCVNTQGPPWAAMGILTVAAQEILTAIKYLMPRGF